LINQNYSKILINLIQNAKEALDELNNQNKQITLDIQAVDEDNICILIDDNGIGIKPENMGRIFSFGFTDKESRHGFGLHSCLLTAKELGGPLLLKAMD